MFLNFKTSFGCREINFPTTDGRCEQNTHSYSMYRTCTVCQHITLHSLIIFHHANTRGSSLGVPETFCHPRVMSHSLHLTLTTSTSSLSLTSPILQSSSHTLKRIDARSKKTLRRFTAEWRILGNLPHLCHRGPPTCQKLESIVRHFVGFEVGHDRDCHARCTCRHRLSSDKPLRVTVRIHWLTNSWGWRLPKCVKRASTQERRCSSTHSATHTY